MTSITVVVDKYAFQITMDENGTTKVEYLSKVENLPPVVTIADKSNTTSSITVNVTTRRNEEGKLEYYIKKSTEGENSYQLNN